MFGGRVARSTVRAAGRLRTGWDLRRDLDSVIETVLRISQLVTDFPSIVEMDINPLVVYDQGQGSMVLDARIILNEQ